MATVSIHDTHEIKRLDEQFVLLDIITLTKSFSQCKDFTKVFSKCKWPDKPIKVFEICYRIDNPRGFVFPSTIKKLFLRARDELTPIVDNIEFPKVSTLAICCFDLDEALNELAKKKFWNGIKELEIFMPHIYRKGEIVVKFSDWPESLTSLYLQNASMYSEPIVNILNLPETLEILKVRSVKFKIDYDRLPMYLRELVSEEINHIENMPPLLEKINGRSLRGVA